MHNRQIYLVGDASSKTNKFKGVAWLGAKCESRLRSWLNEFNITLESCKLINQIEMSEGDFYRLAVEVYNKQSIVVGFGRLAAQKLRKAQLTFLYMPHPSSLSRTLNDSEYEKICLARLGAYLGVEHEQI